MKGQRFEAIDIQMSNKILYIVLLDKKKGELIAKKVTGKSFQLVK